MAPAWLPVRLVTLVPRNQMSFPSALTASMCPLLTLTSRWSLSEVPKSWRSRSIWCRRAGVPLFVSAFG
eukprot:11207814-Lingulodinium_polyedra.AAC.1